MHALSILYFLKTSEKFEAFASAMILVSYQQSKIFFVLMVIVLYPKILIFSFYWPFRLVIKQICDVNYTLMNIKLSSNQRKFLSCLQCDLSHLRQGFFPLLDSTHRNLRIVLVKSITWYHAELVLLSGVFIQLFCQHYNCC